MPPLRHFRAIISRAQPEKPQEHARLLLDGNGFLAWNAPAMQLLEAESANQLHGRHPPDILVFDPLQATSPAVHVAAQLEIARRNGEARFEWLVQTLRGRRFPAEVSFSSVRHEGREVVQVLLRELPRASNDDRVPPLPVHAIDTAERRLAEQNAYFKHLFDASPLGVVVLDRNEVIENANEAWQQMFGYSLAEVRGHRINDCIVPDVLRDEAAHLSRRILDNETIQFHSRRRRSDGQEIEVSFIGAPIVFDGEQIGIYGIYTDQTGNVYREREFQRQKEVAELTLSAISDAVIRIGRDGLIAYVNQAAERLLGMPHETLVGRNFHALCRFESESDAERITFRSLSTDSPLMTLADSAILKRRDGSSVAVEGAITALPAKTEGGGVIVMRDVSERRRAQRQLAYRATHDSLTGLWNREELERRTAKVICDSITIARPASLIFIDLDQFKVVNDTCGHQAGDRLLKRVASAIRLMVSRESVVARLGGDEFAVLLTDHDSAQAREVAEVIMESIRDIRFFWKERLFRVGASMGIAEVRGPVDDVARLLAEADSACYAAKDQGRGRVKIASDTDSQINQRRVEMDWIGRINHALENSQFVLFRQQIARIHEQESMRHWEVLVRMMDTTGELVSPDRFIPAAERYGLMPAIDRWVIERVFNHLELFPAGKDTYAINVSGTSISDEEFSDFIVACFRKFRVSPSNICFEITETAAAANLEHALTFMAQVQALGCRVSLDDFGSGFSSFTYLKTFGINYLKIDGSFVRDIDKDPVNRVFVESIDRIGKSLGIHTIAEYVENDAVLARLREIGVDSAQGHFIDRPKAWIE